MSFRVRSDKTQTEHNRSAFGTQPTKKDLWAAHTETGTEAVIPAAKPQDSNHALQTRPTAPLRNFSTAVVAIDRDILLHQVASQHPVAPLAEPKRDLERDLWLLHPPRTDLLEEAQSLGRPPKAYLGTVVAWSPLFVSSKPADGSTGALAKSWGRVPVRLSRKATISAVPRSLSVWPSCTLAMMRTASGMVWTEPSWK